MHFIILTPVKNIYTKTSYILLCVADKNIKDAKKDVDCPCKAEETPKTNAESKPQNSEEKVNNDKMQEKLSDEEKCRKNWSRGVQNTEDFFAGKGHQNKASKEVSNESTSIPLPATDPKQLSKPVTTDAVKDTPTKPVVVPTEEPKAPRVPQGDCVVCDRAAKAICSGNPLLRLI